jgi:hypothetical protein
LRSGASPTIADVRGAGEAAPQAAVNAAHTWRYAADVHRRAAEAHWAAANAMPTDDDLDRAEWYRQQADNDDLAAEAELFRS